MSLSFEDLRRANDARQAEWPGNEKADLAFRAVEFAGEAGEVAEATKKILRHQLGIHGSVVAIDHLADEIGDALISLDLLARQAGIDLSEAVVSKFNRTSKKYGLATTLSAGDTPA